MNEKLEHTLQSIDQAAVADATASALTAVVSNASAPDSALAGLRQARDAWSTPEERAAVAALQAYGVSSTADVLCAGLEADAGERAAHLGQALEADADGEQTALLGMRDDAGAAFKSRLCLHIATRCAEMIAGEIERDKQGHFEILDQQDAQVFAARQAAHREQRMNAAREFLATLPQRHPSFGAALFADIRQQVEREVAQRHQRPDIHHAVAELFDSALAAMPASMRDAAGQQGNVGRSV